ncbi:putative Ig domain-containing protein, partial [Nostoc sp.]|uniref:putative Ig domain-containing protein n=1 Tax=Nostoc sp. TaxID=1180 RepID=UPI002FF6851A
YSGDGKLDLILTGSGISKLYKNNGSGVLTEDTSLALPGVNQGSVAWGDYSGDGKLDLILTGSGISKLYKNNGSGVLTEDTSLALPGVNLSSVAWGDYSGDGKLDLILTGGSNSGNISKLYKNNGSGVLTEDTSLALPGVNFSSVAWGDYSGDGKLDLILTGNSNSGGGISKLYKNNGSGVLSEDTSLALPGVAGSSVAWGDYSGDGKLDLILTGYSNNGFISKLYKNALLTLNTPTAISYTDTANDDIFTAQTDTLVASGPGKQTLTYGIDGGTVNGTTVNKTGAYGTLSLNTSTGAYTFTPVDSAIEALTSNATDSFTVTVSDGNGGTDSKILALNLTGVNDTPTLNTPIAISYTDTANDDTFAAQTGTLAANDRDSGQTLTYGITGGTVNGTTVTKTGAYGTLSLDTSTGAYTFTPVDSAIEALTSNATEGFNVTVSDATATDNKTLNINLTGVNDTPTLNTPIAISYTDTANDDTFAAQTGTLAANDRDSGQTLTYGIINGTVNGTTVTKIGAYGTLSLDTTTGAYTFTPDDSGIEALTSNVTEGFPVTVSDGTATDNKTLNINLTGVNDTPTLNTPIAISYTDTANDDTFAAQTGTLAANDRDSDQTLTYGITGGTVNGTTVSKIGTYGTLSLNTSTGAYTFTPVDSAIEALTSKATEGFTVTVSDATATDNKTLDINLTGVNDAPILQNAIADQIAKPDTAFSFTFDANTFNDVDAGDNLTYSATLQDGSNIPSWLKFNAATRTFSGTPTKADVSVLKIKLTATDTSDQTVIANFALKVDNVNHPPTLQNAIADQIAKPDTAFSFTFDANTFNDVDAGDNLTYSATLQDGSNIPSWLKFNAATRTFSGTPTNADVVNLTIEVQAKDNDGVSATDTFALAVEDNKGTPTSKLSKIADDIFKISDSSSKSKLEVTLTGQSSNLVNELGVFTVDDAQGNINGIAPGAAGYAQAALDRAKVIFSAIANLPNGFNTDNLTHLLEFNSDDNFRFYLVKNSTTDAVRTGVTPLTDILFSDPLTQKITDLGNDDFSLAWKDGGNNATDFNNLVVKIQSTNDSLPLGTNLQGNSQGEVIDLRGVTNQVKADFVVNREAAFNNFIGFYQVADENGGIDTNGDGKADILTGQAGYTEAAVRGRVAGIDLTVNNQGSATSTGTFQPGSIFVPFIIANGMPDALLDSNPNNDPAVYFPFLGANTDKVDHIRLLGNNVFGFEDLASGGDKDFNDMIVRVNMTIA